MYNACGRDVDRLCNELMRLFGYSWMKIQINQNVIANWALLDIIENWKFEWRKGISARSINKRQDNVLIVA
jgi:hypothetical protein